MEGWKMQFIYKFLLLVVLILNIKSCRESATIDTDVIETSNIQVLDQGGAQTKFKVPVPMGFEWEVTQSWGEHCQECNAKGYSKKYGDYCDEQKSSHTWSCCKYSWDFNLTSKDGVSLDLGKPVLASGDGTLKKIGDNPAGWGNYVVVDHGENICTLYAHMLEGSTDHLVSGQTVCQGLKLGEVGETGNVSGPHLHFQFQECNTQKPIPMGFTDGNGIPKCTIEEDLFTNGEYTFLKLTNVERESCDDDVAFGDAELPENDGWVESECGTLDGCPLNPNCGNQAGHKFGDNNKLSALVADAAAYLYQECAIQGKNDGKLHAEDKITRAEALKIALYLFGMMDGCDDEVPFADVGKNDWYYEVVACAVDNGIVDSNKTYFNPNQEVNFVEAAKFLVEAADDAGVITIKSGEDDLPKIDPSHWGHKYVQTIYEYGGISSTAKKYSADQKIPRGEYLIMAASLSPCFCGNVKCEDGCQCNQDTFACSDPNDKSPGVGGATLVWPPDHAVPEEDTEEEPEDEPEDNPEEDPADSPEDIPEDKPEVTEPEEDPEEDPEEEEIPKLSIKCDVDEAETECSGEEAVYEVICSVMNSGQKVVKIDNLTMKLDTLYDCMVTDGKMKTGGAAYVSIEAGETKKISGGFEISCTYTPAKISVVFDLFTKVDGNVVSNFDFMECEITLPEGGEELCKVPTIPDNPVCVPACSGKSCGGDGCGGSCGSCSSGKNCSGAGQCVAAFCVPQCDGKQCGSDGCGGNCGDCMDGYNCKGGVCEKESVPVNAPEVSLTLSSPGGTMEVATANWLTLFKSNPLPEGNHTITFTSKDLPAMILIKSGPKGFDLQMADKTLGTLDFWIPYAGPITFSPPGDVSFKGTGATLPDPYLPVLVRVPSKN